MDQSSISIVMTVLNGGKTIRGCLDSIANQSYTDYELVIVDGGSTDDTIDIINAVCVRRKSVKIVPGIGLYAGLNAGVAIAQGEWIYFLGCDDELFDSTTLYKISKNLSASSAKIVAGPVKYTNGFIMTPKTGSPLLMRYQLHHQGTVYHKSLFQFYTYNEKLSIASDYEFNVRTKLDRVPCAIMNDIIAIYGHTGISSEQYKKNFSEVREVHNTLFKGFSLVWITIYCWTKQFIWLMRNEMGLLNMKYKFKMILKDCI